jgi:hypothetical protein
MTQERQPFKRTSLILLEFSWHLWKFSLQFTQTLNLAPPKIHHLIFSLNLFSWSEMTPCQNPVWSYHTFQKNYQLAWHVTTWNAPNIWPYKNTFKWRIERIRSGTRSFDRITFFRNSKFSFEIHSFEISLFFSFFWIRVLSKKKIILKDNRTKNNLYKWTKIFFRIPFFWK